MAASAGTAVVVGTAAAAIAEMSATPRNGETRAAAMAARVGPRAVTSDPFRV
jgi:hypothetical protein